VYGYIGNGLKIVDFDLGEFRELLESIRLEYGYDFTDYSEASLKRRMAHFMSGHQIHALDELRRILLKNEVVFEEFIQEVSVTVTEMFRDPSFYKSLRDNVMKRLATYPSIKIWIAGCATGEEVYSVAILLREHGLLQRSVIYATDINQKSLQTAKEGIYSIAHMRAYTENYMNAGGEKSFSEYYKANHDSALFEKSLRQNIVFSPHNLTADKSFNEFQVIICRNVLIYFNQNLQEKVINLFYESLCPFGFLGLGSKESLLFASRRNYFEEIVKKERIYMKTG
jgi:chemotaxis protein methyltransferase CheR